MSKWGSKKDKIRVATRATLTKAYPPIRRKIFAKIRLSGEAIKIRHGELKSWDELSRELGGINPGTLINVMKGKRHPTNKLINRLNRIYGTRIPPAEVTVRISPCSHCGKVHPPSKRHVSSNPTLLKFIREVAVPFLAAREQD